MICYHIDRQNTFPEQPDQQLLHTKTANTDGANAIFKKLYPKGISKTGERYLNPFDVKTLSYEDIRQTCENYRIYSIEYALEVVRLLQFKCHPSRFTSLFACEQEEDVRTWAKILSRNSMDMTHATVKTIEITNGYFIGDSAWRDEPLKLVQQLENGEEKRTPAFSPFAYHYWAIQYWLGKQTREPRTEVLCRLPVLVLNSLPLVEFLGGVV